MKQQNDANALLEFLKLTLPDLDLVFVEGGAFQMGDEVGDLLEFCRPIHRVEVPSFYTDACQVLCIQNQARSAPACQTVFSRQAGNTDNTGCALHKTRCSSVYMGKYPVTQRLWQAVMGNNPSYFKGERRPVESVSWDDAQAFIKKLNLESEQGTSSGTLT